MNTDTLLLFSFVSFFYVISPGPAIFLAIYNGAVYGPKVVMITAFGNIIGLLALSVLSIGGLSALVLASSTLFLMVKLMGASYLIYLGLRQFLMSTKSHLTVKTTHVLTQKSYAAGVKEGFLVAITNPKAILFFAALFPQFLNLSLPMPPQFFIMTLLFMLFSFISLSSYGYLSYRIKKFVPNTRVSSWLQRISGGLFIAMGASLLQLRNMR